MAENNLNIAYNLQTTAVSTDPNDQNANTSCVDTGFQEILIKHAEVCRMEIIAK